MEKPNILRINYLYFGTFFLVLAFLTLSNLFYSGALVSTRFFFFLYSLGQVLLEIGLLIFLSWLTKKYLPKIFFMAFIGFTFLLFILHWVDFLLTRLFNMTFWSAFADFIIAEEWGNFLELLYASGIHYIVWIGIFSFILITPLIGYGIYQLTDKLSQKKPLYFSRDLLVLGIFSLFVSLSTWDFSASRILNANDYHDLLGTLPWKKTFLSPQSVWLSTIYPVKKPIKEEEKSHALAFLKDKTPQHKPNVYLLIIESLREDCITKEIAPNLYQFKQKNIHFDLAFSNANATHISWYSIFHSNFPFHWKEAKKNKDPAGIPLKVLKEIGYKTHVYASTSLRYYALDDLMFGKKQKFADSFLSFPHIYPEKAHTADTKIVQAFFNNLSTSPNFDQANLHVFFFDSTHFNYSWPKQMTKFTPISAPIGFLKAHFSKKNIGKIKNNYRNAVHFVDSLFGRFCTILKKNNLYDDAVIIVTGDHGEEFFEHGRFFHSSDLNHYQTNVPLYYKFGKNQRPVPNTSLTSHMEIFPSILDYLFDFPILGSHVEGDSIFDSTKWPYVITSRYNGSKTPYEFFIHNGQTKLIARFMNHSSVFEKTDLQVLYLKNYLDQRIVISAEETEEFIWTQFGGALRKIFPSN